MDERTIYNCHTHLFTHDNIPDDYYPFFLVQALRIPHLRWLLTAIMKAIVPWSKDDGFTAMRPLCGRLTEKPRRRTSSI